MESKSLIYITGKQKFFMRKAQASAEYLMTYGIAFTVIILVLGVLYGIGVFKTSGMTKSTCFNFVYFKYVDHKIRTDGNMDLTIVNSYKLIQIDGVQIRLKGGSWGGNMNQEPFRLPPAERATLNIYNSQITGDEGAPYDIEVKVSYHTIEGLLNREDVATCTGNFVSLPSGYTTTSVTTTTSTTSTAVTTTQTTTTSTTTIPAGYSLDSGFLRDVLYIGPYDTVCGCVGSCPDMISDDTGGAESETTVSPSGPGEVMGSFTWQEFNDVHDGSEGNSIDFQSELFGTMDNKGAYIFAYLWSPVDRNIGVIVGSDDGVRVYINGALVHNNDAACRAWNWNQDSFNSHLNFGWNTLLMAVYENTGAWRGSIRLRDEFGVDLNDIVVSTTAP